MLQRGHSPRRPDSRVGKFPMLTDIDHDALPHRYTRPAESDKTPRQALGRYRRRSHDRACLAPRGGGRLRAGAGGDRRGSRAGRDTKAGGEAIMTRSDHPSGLRPGVRGRAGARPDAQAAPSSMCRATCRRSIPPCVHAAWIRSTMRGRYRDDRRRDRPRGREQRSQRGEGGRPPLGARPDAACALFHPRDRALRARGRSITISASMPIAGPRWSVSFAAAVAARAAREIGAAARARSRHAHRRRPRRHGAARRRYAARSRARPRTARPRPTDAACIRPCRTATNRIAFQGEPGANSASRLPRRLSAMEPLPCPTFEDAFTAVETGKADARHDPDRELDGRPRRRHPPSVAGIGPAHRRRAFPADAATS